MFFFTEDLLNSAKLRTLAPISQTTFQDADLILLANEELQLKLVSDIQSIREDFFLTSALINLQAGVDRYVIPNRAIGNALKAVFYVDTQGNVSSPINRIDVDKSYLFAGTNSIPSAFYFEGDEIVLAPKPSTSAGQIKVSFMQRPNQLVLTATCAKITGISSASGTTTFTVDTDLTASLSVGVNVDFLKAQSPFMLWANEVPITAITSTTIAVTQTNVNDQAGNVRPTIGDYICPAKQCNIPQVPQEFHPMLAQMVALRLMESMGDMNKYQVGAATLAAARREAIKLIKNRVESSPDKVDSRGGILGRTGNRYGLR